MALSGSSVAFAASLGTFVGMGELLARYRADPKRLIRTPSAWIYVLINALAASGALVLIHTFGWTFGATTDDAIRLTQILVAGFGAMAFFRSSLFITQVNGRDIGIGPSAVLTTFLDAVDRVIDRFQATARSSVVGEAMKGVSFEKAREALPTYCLALMQNVSQEDQDTLAREIAELNRSGMDDSLKALSLGLELMNVVGPTVLQAAVKSLGDNILRDEDNSKPAWNWDALLGGY